MELIRAVYFTFWIGFVAELVILLILFCLDSGGRESRTYFVYYRTLYSNELS